MNLLHDVQRYLKEHDIRLSKALGQHFLIDERVVRAVVQAAGLRGTEHVVEIGAGLGILTKELLRHAATVTAIEVDRRFAHLLSNYVCTEAMDPSHLTIIHGNALKVAMPESSYTVVANIPYQITSFLFRKLLLHTPRRPEGITLLVQREVAERICSEKNISILTVLVKLFADPRIVRIVPPSAFLPPPAVDSAILSVPMLRIPRATESEITTILRDCSLAFGKKRKMLRASLGKIHGGMERLERAKVSPEQRPETLSIEEWIALARA
jgi:16S rRNA (adenine1518-N6/adenine1519-N6)-dimethyltransferase